MMGIILNTVDPVSRATASSLSIFIEFVVGMLPAPYLYGLVQQLTSTLDSKGNNTSRGGMYVIFFSSVFGGVCLLFALIFRNSSMKKGLERTKEALKRSNHNMTAE